MEITSGLMQALVREQLPQWADLPVRPVAVQGWDNRTFRLGDGLSVRLPSADGYVPGLLRESLTLAVLHDRLDVRVPWVVAEGAPTALFGRPWQVREWIPGQTLASVDPHVRGVAIAGVASAVAALQGCATAGGPWAGPSSAYRGCHVSVMGEDVERALAVLPADQARAGRRLWDAASRTVWDRAPVWVHGDVAPGNVLFDADGHLVSLIDFGQTCVGDPACDLGFAWLSCSTGERDRVKAILGLDEATWLRGAAWALWKTLVTTPDDMPVKYGRDRADVLTDLLDGSAQQL